MKIKLEIDTFVPGWAKYAAQDRCGTFNFYSSRPIANDKLCEWVLPVKKGNYRLVFVFALFEEKNWKTKIYEIEDIKL